MLPAIIAVTSQATRIAMAAVIALAGALAPGPAVAQTSAGGSLSGVVTDSSPAPVSGATVTVAGAVSPVLDTVVTDRAGQYRFSHLPAGAYTITVTRDGFARTVQESVTIREGLNARLNLMLIVGAVGDQVVVRGETPLLEWKHATQALNISGDLQRQLPLSSLQTWADVLQVAPAVVTAQGRFPAYTMHGAGAGSGVFLVDGADVTSVLQGSPLYAQFARPTIEDIQVTTSAPDAASPLGLGPIVRLASRSGTNQFHGDVVVARQPKQWNANNAAQGQSLTIDVRQAEGSLGGPIVPARWWFFGSGRVMRNRTGISRSAQQVQALRGLQPGFAPFDNPWDGEIGFGKVTGRFGRAHDLMTSFGRDVVTLGGAQPHEAAVFRSSQFGGSYATARLASPWGNSVLSTLSAAYNGRRQQNVNHDRNITGLNVYDTVFSSGGRLVGSGLLGTLNGSPFASVDFPVRSWTLSADVLWYRGTGRRSHELRAGAYLQQRRNRWVTHYSNDGRQLEEAVLRVPGDITSGYVPFRRQIIEAERLTSLHVDSRDVAVYVQDAWRPLSRLTVTGGVRVDLVDRRDRLFDVVTQDSVESGPRIGINYALTADHRQVVRASWSRVHDNLSVNETQAGTNLVGTVDWYDTARDGSFATALITPPRSARASNLVIDLDGYHQPRVDELGAGYRRQFAGSTSVGVHAMRREYRNRPAAVERNGIYDAGMFIGYRDPSQNEIYTVTANRWNWPVTTALMVEGTRETARLQVVATYTRQWNHLAGTWQPGDPAALIQPDAFRNAQGIGAVSGCTVGPCADSNSLSGANQTGTWRDHVATAAVSYRGGSPLLLSATYTFQSGPWSGPILQRRSQPDSRFGPPTVTLENGRVVSNPLATPLRFAYQTRAEGQIQLPSMHAVNLRAGWRLTLGRRRVDLALTVLNVANHAADQAFQPGATERGSASFSLGANRQLPRTAQMTAHLAF